MCGPRPDVTIETQRLNCAGRARQSWSRLRVHNHWNATTPKGPWTPAPALQARFDAGIAYEAELLATLFARLGNGV
jgi:hypothetical protein